MKRNVILVIGLLLAVLFCPVASAAEEAENYDGFGAAEAQQQMPDAAREYIVAFIFPKEPSSCCEEARMSP